MAVQRGKIIKYLGAGAQDAKSQLRSVNTANQWYHPETPTTPRYQDDYIRGNYQQHGMIRNK